MKFFEKILSCVIAFLLCTMIIPPTSLFAEDNIEIWDGQLVSTFSGGNGTQDNPFIITRPGQLAYIMTYGNSNYGIYYTIANDLYFNSDDVFDRDENNVIIGIKEGKTARQIVCLNFMGILDGAGHSLYGVFRDSRNDLPVDGGANFFGMIRSGVNNKVHSDSKIMNLTIQTGYIVGCSASVFCDDIFDNARLENCINYATAHATGAAGVAMAFGVTGNNGVIYQCANYGHMIADGSYILNSPGVKGIGGGTMIRCINYADLYTSCFAGGIGSGQAVQCINYGNIVTEQGCAGGICSTGTPIGCINYGNVTCNRTQELNLPFENLGIAGGIVGRGTAKNCINYGTVTAYIEYAGGGIVSILGGNDIDEHIVEGCIFAGSYGGVAHSLAGIIERGMLVDCWYIGEDDNSPAIWDVTGYQTDQFAYRINNITKIEEQDLISDDFLNSINQKVTLMNNKYATYWNATDGKIDFVSDKNMCNVSIKTDDSADVLESIHLVFFNDDKNEGNVYFATYDENGKQIEVNLLNIDNHDTTLKIKKDNYEKWSVFFTDEVATPLDSFIVY